MANPCLTADQINVPGFLQWGTHALRPAPTGTGYYYAETDTGDLCQDQGTWVTIASASGGGATWGSITGTLSSQTDLQTALNGKQPLNSDLTDIAALTPANDDVIQRKAGHWVSRTISQLATDLRTVFDTVYASLAGLSTQVFSVAAATNLAHAVPANQIITNALRAYTTSGTPQNYTFTTSPSPAAYTTNERWTIKFHASNTTGLAATINRDGLGSKGLYYVNSIGTTTACIQNIFANMQVDIIYTGTIFLVVDPPPESGALWISGLAGSIQSFSKPANAKMIKVVLVGGGGGGGGGGRSSGAVSRQGGSGGGGGAYAERYFIADDLPSSVSYYAGLGGTGGNGATGAGAATDGNPGEASYFGTYFSAYGGGGGRLGANTAVAGGGGGGGGTAGVGQVGGTTAAGGIGGTPGDTSAANYSTVGGQGASGGAGGNSAGCAENGGGGGSGHTSAGAPGSAGGSSLRGGAGGGCGGGTTSGPAVVSPSDGGSANSYAVGGGGAAGTSGASPTDGTQGANGDGIAKTGNGGGGGGSTVTANTSGKRGGDGGQAGGGGGGGGSGTNTGNGGNGGDGGAGNVWITWW